MKEALELAKIGLILSSPILFLLLTWFILARYVIKKKKKFPNARIVVAPAQIARRVIYHEELEHLRALKGDVAYVINEKEMYFHDGTEWVKAGHIASLKNGTVGK